MTPKQIYNHIYHYIGNQDTIICNLHSACSPIKGKNYICRIPKTTEVRGVYDRGLTALRNSVPVYDAGVSG